MEDREKIEFSNQDDYILRINDEAFVVKRLKEKVDDFLVDDRQDFFDFVKNTLGINCSNKYQGDSKFYEAWCNEGIECAVLKPGETWKTGKVRFRMKVEFFPDEPEEVEENGYQDVDNIIESPLDEIRQQLTDEN